MAVIEQKVTDRYAAYNGDCCEVMPDLPSGSIHLSIYSPPFADLYQYSSSERDLGNCRSYEEFLEHYAFVVREVARLTMPGRITAVHCTDLRLLGGRGFRDFQGDIIRMHIDAGFYFHGRIAVWREPLRMALRTRTLHLAHRQIVKDSAQCSVASADYLVLMRRHGENPVPLAHPDGLSSYAGAREPPGELVAKFGRGWPDPKTNKLSHWIWQQYASSFWDDVRQDRVLPFREARESDEEKHACPLQLDIVERALALWSLPGERVLTPFMGVGSEVYSAVRAGRKGIGVELKPSYYRQALKNIASADDPTASDQLDLFGGAEAEASEEPEEAEA